MDALQITNDLVSKFYPGLMGVKITHLSKDKGVIETEVTAKHMNPAGVVHGGAIVTLADTIATVATVAAYDMNPATTVNLNVSFLKSVKTGKITAVATPLKIGKRLAVWDVKCYDDAGDIAASVTASLVPQKKGSANWESHMERLPV